MFALFRFLFACYLFLIPSTGKFFAIPLDSPVTFDTACTLPACVPNGLITTDDLDRTSCRVVASGAYDDSDMASECFYLGIYFLFILGKAEDCLSAKDCLNC